MKNLIKKPWFYPFLGTLISMLSINYEKELHLDGKGSEGPDSLEVSGFPIQFVEASNYGSLDNYLNVLQFSVNSIIWFIFLLGLFKLFRQTSKKHLVFILIAIISSPIILHFYMAIFESEYYWPEFF